MSEDYSEYDDYRRTAFSYARGQESSQASESAYAYPRSEEYRDNRLNNRIAQTNGPFALSVSSLDGAGSTRGPYVCDLPRQPPVPSSLRPTQDPGYTKTLPSTNEQNYESLDTLSHGTKAGLVYGGKGPETRVKTCLLVVAVFIVGVCALAALGMSIYVLFNWPKENEHSTRSIPSTRNVTDETPAALMFSDTAFSASITTEQMDIKNRDVIIWNSCQMRGCKHYNTITGEFTAPVSGLYMFTVHKFGMNDHGSFYILINNQPKYYARDFIQGNRAVLGSATILVELTTGEKVSVQNLQSLTILGTVNGTATSWFSGTLV